MSESWRVFADPDAVAALETNLCDRLAAFFSFGAHACYFTENGPDAPEWLPLENRILLPLLAHGRMKLVLRLDSVRADLLRLLPLLPAILGLCLENAELAEAARRDPASGLPNESALVDAAVERIEALHSGCCKGSFGLLVFMWTALPESASHAGRDVLEETAAELAAAFRRSLPPGAFGAAIGRLSGKPGFAVLCDAAGRGGCQRIASGIAASLAGITCVHPLTHESVPVEIETGHSIYPGDISGRELFYDPFRQALLLRDRALLAACIAARSGAASGMAWNWIPSTGCMIEENRGHGILRLSPGRDGNIRIGQRFDVVGMSGHPKARVIVREVGERDAYAELLHVTSAATQPAPGDRLLLDLDGASEDGLPDRAWFFRRFEELAKHAPAFSLAITTFKGADGLNAAQSACRDFLDSAQGEALAGVMTGSYGRDGIVTYIPGAGDCHERFMRLHEAAAGFGLKAITGIFSYPCLNLDLEASEACALKALEYASLLPAPHIGTLDGLALAISGDKLYSQGEELAALEEYRRALMLIPDDAAILNAYAVCLAALHRSTEARRNFQAALAKCEDKALAAKICYNLGNLSQKEEDLEAARSFYRAAIRADPAHIYAWTRLAQVAALSGKPASGASLYRHAERLAYGMPEALAMIRRQLARLEAGRSRLADARDILHDSLLRNPGDRASLLALAKTYISDDPATAESLARRCIDLGPEARAVLIKALFAQGRGEEAASLGDGPV